MRPSLRRVGLAYMLAVALAACGSAPATGGAPPSSAGAASAVPVATAAPAPGTPRRGTAAALGITLIPAAEPPVLTPVRPITVTAVPAPEGAAAIPHVQQAIADLATRLAVDPSSITVLRAEEVDWPDGSLGCPREDMSYTQAIVNGVFVQLEAGGQTYNYHGRAGGAPFLCTSKRAVLPENLPPELRGGGGEDT